MPRWVSSWWVGMRTSTVSADMPDLAASSETANSPCVVLRAHIRGPFPFLRWRGLCRGLAQLPLVWSPWAVSGAVVGTVAHGACCDGLCTARKEPGVSVSV